MSTVKQRNAKATFFRVVRAATGMRCLFIENALFSLVRVSRFAIMAYSVLAIFRLYLATKTWESKGKTWDALTRAQIPVLGGVNRPLAMLYG
jgi:hypothetical protein